MRYDKLPPELTELPQWVCVWNGSKIPMQAREKKAASSVMPETWAVFDDARVAVDAGGLGFVFNNNGIIGIDIDAGFDEDGFLSALSIDVMSQCQSYTEKSRSGRGIHVLVKGRLPFRGRNNGSGVEIYQSSRYFIMTGDVLIFPEIIENQKAIDYIIETYFPEVEGDTGCSSRRIYSPTYPKPTDGVIPLRPTYPPIVEGGRNNAMASLAGQLHNLGYSKKDIYRELCFANEQACVPPLPERDLQTIVNSITKYRR